MTTVYHASGTNRMGVEADEAAVVGSNDLVFGVGGLRAVDASAMLVPDHGTSTEL